MRVFLSIGDRSAANYVHAIFREGFEDKDLLGITDRRLESIGIKSVASLDDITVVGLVEALPKLPRVLKVFRRSVEALKGCDVLIACDAPSFNLRLIKKARDLGVRRVIYFISPQVWAWKPERAKVIAEFCDHLVVILPFEVDIYRPLESERFRVHYVGHPLVDLVRPGVDRETFLQKVQTKGDLINLMPGSRWGEIKRHVPLMGEVLKKLGLRGVVPTFRNFRSFIAQRLRGAVVITEEEVPLPAYTAMFYSRSSLIASGTASLEAAIAGSPHVVIYKVNALTYWIGKRFVRVPYVSLPNLILGRGVVPELLNPRLEDLLGAVSKLWESDKERALQREAFLEIRDKIGGSGSVSRLRSLFQELLSF